MFTILYHCRVSILLIRLAYFVDLISGMVKLRAQDIDTKLNMVHIKVAKGQKDI